MPPSLIDAGKLGGKDNAHVGEVSLTGILLTPGWWRIGKFSRHSNSGNSAIVMMLKNYGHYNPAAVIVAVSQAGNYANASVLSSVNKNFTPKVRLVIDSSDNVYFDIYYDNGGNNQIEATAFGTLEIYPRSQWTAISDIADTDTAIEKTL